jgi:hypothetical protein
VNRVPEHPVHRAFPRCVPKTDTKALLGEGLGEPATTGRGAVGKEGALAVRYVNSDPIRPALLRPRPCSRA